MDPINTGSESATPTQAVPQKTSVGPLVGAFIILIVLAGGALYLWGAKLDKEGVNNAPPMILGDDSAGLPPTRSSDSVADIEADVSATDMDRLETELEADMQAVESSL